MQLLKSHPHRWGKGSVHLSWKNKNYIPRCRKEGSANHTDLFAVTAIHGEYMEGTINDVTCKNCRRIYFRINPKEQEKLFKMGV